MRIVTRVLAFVTGLAIICAVLYAAFVATTAAVGVFVATDKTVVSALITASATVIVAVAAVVLGKLYELRVHVQKENRDKKIPVYEDLLKYFFRTLNNSKSDSLVDDPEVVEFFTRFNERFIIWASDDVVRA
jgi:LPS O-antigen subunit length determinant protein (WzzB/FepE family)